MYIPSDEILSAYANLLVKFALREGRGIQRGDVVQVTIPDTAKPLYKEIQRAILQRGGHPKMHLLATGTEQSFFRYARGTQLTFFPAAYKKAEIDLIDHHLSIISESDPTELQEIEPKKVFRTMDARRRYRDWLFEKEQQGKLSWTLALYGTEGMAKEANMTLEEYWSQIIHGCYLDTKNPIAEWKKIQREQQRLKYELCKLEIESLHMESARIDLTVLIGKRRKWLGGSCRNIPSFEIFISPDWRGTEGTIAFNQPLYGHGTVVRDVSLEFRRGKIVSAKASQGAEMLQAMIKRKNANKIGEFSLTDSRLSRITKYMANTLFDENIGGTYGNTHIAIGRAYKDSFTGDMNEPSAQDWEDMGFNDSPEHTDLISTEDRIVTATLQNGKKKIVFKEGRFTL